MLAFKFLSSGDVSQRLAERVRALRVEQNLSRAELAARCGLSVGTLQRFEGGHTISLDNFVRLVQGLGRLDDLVDVLADRPAVTIEHLEQLAKASRRKRPYRQRSGG